MNAVQQWTLPPQLLAGALHCECAPFLIPFGWRTRNWLLNAAPASISLWPVQLIIDFHATIYIYSAGAIHYWLPCRCQLSHWLAQFIECLTPIIFANNHIGRRNLLYATPLLFYSASAIHYWMPRRWQLSHWPAQFIGCHISILFANHPIGRRNLLYATQLRVSIIFMTTTSSSDIIPYSPRDASSELVYSHRLHKREVQLLASTHPSPSSQGPWHSRPGRLLSKYHITNNMGSICAWMPGFLYMPRMVRSHISLSVSAISSSPNANCLNWDIHALAQLYSHSSNPSSAQVVTSPWRFVSVIGVGAIFQMTPKLDSAQ